MECLAYDGHVGIGLAWTPPLPGDHRLYGFLEAEGAVGDEFVDNVRIGPAGSVGWAASLTPDWTAHVEARGLVPLIGRDQEETWEVEIGTSVRLGRDLALRARGRIGTGEEEGDLELHWHY